MTFPVAEAVPVAPAAGYTVVALGALIAFVVSWGLAHSWGATFGRFLRWLGGKEIKASVHHIGFVVQPFGFALQLDHDVQAWLSQAMALSERAMVHSFTEAYKWATLTVTAPFHLGEATYSALARLFHAAKVGTPTFIRDVIVKPLDKATRATIATLKANVGHLTHRVDVLGAHVAHTALALPRGLDLVNRELDRVLRDRSRTRDRLHRLEKLLTVVGISGLIAAAMVKMGFKWVKCDSARSLSRRLTCTHFAWLGAFFATTFEALVVLDLCRFALAAQQLARVLVPQLAGVLLVQNAVCLGGGGSYPSAHDAPKVVTKLVLPSAHD